MISTDQETEKALNDEKQLLQDKLAQEANIKLVQDLKTISAAIETSRHPAVVSTEPATVVTPDILPTSQEKALLIKNATQEVDGFLTHQATLQSQIHQSQAPMSSAAAEEQQTFEKEELIQNATKAIEGLITIQAEKIAQENAGLQQQVIKPKTSVISKVSPSVSLTGQPTVTTSPLSVSSDSTNEFQNELVKITQTLEKDYTDKKKGKQPVEVPKSNKILDFLSAAGKIASILLAITPVPTYLGVWNKPRQEQIQRVESISFHYLLVNILSCVIWTSYAFKTQNIDLAIISVFPLIITIILVAIYLSVKPESKLIKQFFTVILISQIFNFDLLSKSLCGLLGTLMSITTNLVPLTFIPEVIRTRDVSGINMPLTVVNLCNLSLWEAYAMIRQDPFMTTS